MAHVTERGYSVKGGVERLWDQHEVAVYADGSVFEASAANGSGGRGMASQEVTRLRHATAPIPFQLAGKRAVSDQIESNSDHRYLDCFLQF